MPEESQEELIQRLQHELGIAATYAQAHRRVVSALLQVYPLLPEAHFRPDELAPYLMILDGWLEHWTTNGTLEHR